MERPPLLTIGIPTYNRAAFLSRLLQQLKAEAEPFGSRVEVLVSDNASSDNTPQVIGEHQSWAQMRVCRQKANIGALLNGIEVIRQARGQYVWMIGDDDLFAAGAIANVVEFLEKNKVGAAILNFKFSSRTAFPVRQRGFLFRTKSEIDGPAAEALSMTQYMGAILLDAELARRVLQEQTQVSGEHLLKLAPDGSMKNLFDIHPTEYLLLECIRRSERFAIGYEPATRPVGDGAFFDSERHAFFLQKGLEFIDDFALYGEWVPVRKIAFFGTRPAQMLRLLLLIRPNSPREERQEIYGLLDRYAAKFRSIRQPAWRLFWLFKNLHQHIPFSANLLWGAYGVFKRIKGAKTFAQENEENRERGARISMTFNRKEDEKSS